jgi:hypothetical protein
MSSIQATIAAKQRAMLPQRLTNGAAVLGRLWRENIRCLGSWSGLCPCPAPTDFCGAKAKWLGLIRELCGGPPYETPWNSPEVLSGTEGYLVLELMSRKMIEATGLTIRIARPGDRVPLRIGPKGTDFQTVIDLAAIDDDAVQAVALDAVVKLQEVFGAR